MNSFLPIRSEESGRRHLPGNAGEEHQGHDQGCDHEIVALRDQGT